MSKVVLRQAAYGILKRMKGGRRHKGFTIVETMIVLAVTGTLFVSAALLINGRQRKTQFTQSIREAHSQIQQAIDEINIGQYQSNAGFRCTATASGPNLTSVGSAEQGTNEGCIFLGKVLQFDIEGTDPEEFGIYTIAGLQREGGNPNGEEVQTLADAQPVVINPETYTGGGRTQKLLYGLTTGKMYYNGVETNNIGAIALVSSLAGYDNGNLQANSQQLNVIPLTGTDLNQSVSASVAAMNTKLASSTIDNDQNPSGGIQICFVSAGTEQSGLITIGSNGRQLSTTLSIKGNKTCS